MQDNEFYAQILGIQDPWYVAEVQLDSHEQRVDIWLSHKKGVRWPCPECQTLLPCRDHAEERIWRHLDTCQFKTYLHARIPRVECPEHKTRQVQVPWAEKSSRFSLLLERFAIDVIKQCSTIKGAAKILHMSWDEVWGVMYRAVERGRARKSRSSLPFIGVDEKSIAKGHSYMTVISDITQGNVEYVTEERKTASLEEFYQQLSQEQLQSIQGVAMDMWDPYIKATHRHVPDADSKIVFDRFHIMKHMLEAVDKVRRKENKVLLNSGEDTLKNTKYIWLYSLENLPDKHRPTLEALKNVNLKTCRAWAIKETLRDFWNYKRPTWAYRFFKRWFYWATHSGLTPIKKKAHTLNNHLDNILTFFKYRLTNAASEGLNSKIMSIKRFVSGFRNKEHFKIAIYFYCGGLDLYPR